MIVNMNNLTTALKLLRCHCDNHCPPGAENGICEVEHGGRCFTAVEEVIHPSTGVFEPEYSYGCFSAGDPAFLQCKGHLVDHEVPQSIECCDDANFCNKNLQPMYKPTNLTEPGVGGHGFPTPNDDYFLLKVLWIAVVALFVIASCILVYIMCKYRIREKKRRKPSNYSEATKPKLITREACCNLDQSSGSGSGMPLLKQRTIGQQVSFKQKIGKGRFGNVYLGEWDGTKVAVKAFPSTEEASWLKEIKIFQLALMQHSNILGSNAWDIHSHDNTTQLIIVMDYHPNGSLHDYLQTRILSEDEALRLSVSAAAGLCHLHSEIEGKPFKPGIAHRDLKSKNILVKANGEACIADFGLAVCSVRDQRGVTSIPDLKVGTKRYMAPEVLDSTMNVQWFESYKQADMYSFALILWEIGRRCRSLSKDGNYEHELYDIPYSNYVSVDPTFEEMRKLVCDEHIRPEIPIRWSQVKFLTDLSKLLMECWHRIPQVRLTSLRVKKTLTEICRPDERIHF